MTLRTVGFGFVLALCAALPAAAAVTVQVAGNVATAAIDVDGAQADLALTFDRPRSTLSAAALGITADALDDAELAALADRLPAGTRVASGLPLLISIEPTALSFANTVRVELHTHALAYTAGSRYRLLKAPAGGAFFDITDEVAPGSVRTRGTTGGFSQFVVVTDDRPSAAVIDEKLERLYGRLDAVSFLLRPTLTLLLNDVVGAIGLGDYGLAIATLDLLQSTLATQSGLLLGNTWSTGERNGNVAGDLLAAIASLRFTIGYLRDFGH